MPKKEKKNSASKSIKLSHRDSARISAENSLDFFKSKQFPAAVYLEALDGSELISSSCRTLGSESKSNFASSLFVRDAQERKRSSASKSIKLRHRDSTRISAENSLDFFKKFLGSASYSKCYHNVWMDECVKRQFFHEYRYQVTESKKRENMQLLQEYDGILVSRGLTDKNYRKR
ncbi:hypothetical protein CEXT_773581 [Caerostris extrusa]|uniref:Uncharacterized protein n=1 Tax=Caerostris extrusa TaxID=172846 RepID=A0AAV4PDY2_CAEEX|nr:hypothetical protein CEXT_773581 [Caerostris extrusa]